MEKAKGFTAAAAAAAKSLQSCLTLCDPIDSSPSGFPVPGILQARTLEWVATPWTAAYQAPPSMRFFRQEYWSGDLRLSEIVEPIFYPLCHLGTKW